MSTPPPSWARPINLVEAARGPKIATEARMVEAWVPYTDGFHRLVLGELLEGTERAVLVAWREADGERREAWIWRNAVKP